MEICEFIEGFLNGGLFLLLENSNKLVDDFRGCRLQGGARMKKKQTWVPFFFKAAEGWTN